jgi:hypothetical protein
MPGKYKVRQEFRTNVLSKIDTEVNAEVHFDNSATVKVYENVHYPDKFANSVFRNNADASEIVFKDLSTQSEYSVKRPTN